MGEHLAIRENLLGYLLNAIEDPEVAAIKAAIAEEQSTADNRVGAAPPENPGHAQREPHAQSTVEKVDSHEKPSAAPHAGIRTTLALLDRAIDPLRADTDHWEPPAGLAARTVSGVNRAIARKIPHKRVFSRPSQPEPNRSRPWLDRMLVAATAIAACVLVVPLIREAIEDSRTRRTERNLGVIAEALHGYADSHRVFPSPPSEGPLSRAGLYAPTLVSERRLVANDGTVLVPGSRLSHSGFRVPTLDEIEAAVDTDSFDDIVRRMGGDFGYTLGHRDADGRLEPIRDRRRAHHPIVADAPDDTGHSSFNHPGGLHHVLFEDGHIERFFHDDVRGDDNDRDHLYRNHKGSVAAGINDEDAVVGASQHAP